MRYKCDNCHADIPQMGRLLQIGMRESGSPARIQVFAPVKFRYVMDEAGKPVYWQNSRHGRRPGARSGQVCLDCLVDAVSAERRKERERRHQQDVWSESDQGRPMLDVIKEG